MREQNHALFLKSQRTDLLEKQEYYETEVHPHFLALELSREEVAQWDEQILMKFGRDEIYEKYRQNRLTDVEKSAWADYIAEYEDDATERQD